MHANLSARFTLAVLLFAAPALAHGYVAITACYQTVPANEVGLLFNDISCDGSGGPNVTVEGGGHLLLDHHTVSGGYLGVAIEQGAVSVIEGPGEIYGVLDGDGCAIETFGRVKIKNVDIHHSRCGIRRAYNFALTLEEVDIYELFGDAIPAGASGPGNGKIRAKGMWIAYNAGLGMSTDGRVSLRFVEFFLNRGGGLVAAGSHRAKLVDSKLTYNGPEGDFIDVQANVVPKLIDTVCGYSEDLDSGTTLGICTND